MKNRKSPINYKFNLKLIQYFIYIKLIKILKPTIFHKCQKYTISSNF